MKTGNSLILLSKMHHHKFYGLTIRNFYSYPKHVIWNTAHQKGFHPAPLTQLMHISTQYIVSPSRIARSYFDWFKCMSSRALCNYNDWGEINAQAKGKYITAKKHFLFWKLHLSPDLQLLTGIVPCGSQLWAIQHTWSTGTTAVATRAGKFVRHQVSAMHNKRALFPCKDPCHVSCNTRTYVSVTCFNHSSQLRHGSAKNKCIRCSCFHPTVMQLCTCFRIWNCRSEISQHCSLYLHYFGHTHYFL